MSYLELRGLTRTYGNVVALRSLDLSIEQGELVSFLGPSGCGKTTTLRLIAGLDSPTSGGIWLAGTNITAVPANRRKMGLVFQNYALFPNMTVADNIAFGLTVAGYSRFEIRQRVAALLAMIKLEGLGRRYPHELSGGQQQRVALARALAPHPTLLLLDEPLSALDARIRVDLRAELRSIQRSLGITTIYVTHDQEEALSLSDRVVVMRDGRVEQVGTPFEIYNAPRNEFVASFVGTLNRLWAEVREPTWGLLSVDGQEVYAASPLPAGLRQQRVVLGLRPECLSLDQASPTVGALNRVNRLSGRVENVAFLGGVVRIQLRLNPSSLSIDVLNHPRQVVPAPGRLLTVSFPREACLILSPERGTTSPSDSLLRVDLDQEVSRASDNGTASTSRSA